MGEMMVEPRNIVYDIYSTTKCILYVVDYIFRGRAVSDSASCYEEGCQFRRLGLVCVSV